jgi:PAS domain S-box-containing protein
MTKQVLVVDNDAFFVEFLAELLERHGYRVVKAYNGREALDRLEDQAYDLMIVDMVMPEVDGRQLIEAVRRRADGGDIPIVAVSGVIIDQLDQLKDLNADYFIAKGPMAVMEQKIEGLLTRLVHLNADKAPIAHHQAPQLNAARTVKTSAPQQVASLFAFTFENIGIGILLLDKDGRIMAINPRASHVLGRSLQRLHNQPFIPLLNKNDQKAMVETCKRLINESDLTRMRLDLDWDGRPLQVVVSLLRSPTDVRGWVLAVEEKDDGQNQH